MNDKMNEVEINATLAAVSNQRNDALNQNAVLTGRVTGLEAQIVELDRIVSEQAATINKLNHAADMALKEKAAEDEDKAFLEG